MMNLTGRVAVVTRGASPIGRVLCTALGRAGAVVAIGDPDPAQAAQLAAEIHAEGGTARSWQTGTPHLAALDELLSNTVGAFGRIDLMVNTSVITPPAAAESLALDAFSECLQLNLDSIFFGCQYAARRMLLQQPAGGTIVNVTSVAGVVAIPGHAAFCAAMAGVTAMTKVLATEWGALGVRVVGLGAGISPDLAASLPVHPPLPGVNTLSHRRLPPPALASISDLGQALVYLAGDEAGHIAGTTLYVDGGWLADGYWE